MKYFLLALLIILGAQSPVRAQRIRFEKDSLAQVFARARQLNKPVFVLLAPPPVSANTPAALQKMRNESGLNAPAVVAALNKDFLSKELPFGKAETAAVVRKYAVTSYPTYLYFGPDGTLLYRNFGNASSEQRYLHDLQAVQQAQADPENLSHLQEEYRQGHWSAEFLKRYIGKHRQLGLRVEPAVLDAYVQLLPVHAFDQPAEVTFILDNGPVVGSKAHQLTRLNPRLYDSLFRSLPLARRVAINNLIIANTMNQAIATKNRVLATQGANFARGSWTNNYQQGSRAYETNMLRFLSAIKDTASYLRSAVLYYDRINTGISADSARKAVAALQAFRQEQLANRQRLSTTAGQPGGMGPNVSRVTTMEPTARRVPPAAFLQELNNGAWSVYQTGTRNSQHLMRALQWSKRTVDLDPAAYNYDTLAHLLYRLRFFSEAAAMQQQAVAVARQEKASTTAYEQELEKIKKRTL
ncbi:hypothetical protein Q3A66_02165 [Hymenobacter sp. BT770]|uniref:hypothetical protein n=1 Tax=Hymenobacter sp. BT770 TaxID=2886942 RepID=UPI001D0F7BA5|nr:hypothetical protein [Hymenobacter sp. BT770]MCC3151566.1 hypothetical protein [Hymenobacter sp. BT770]MDO3413857.1 hypothetical protein [Hymenobacter sp. BT770]